jgi:hypothetical protein
MLLHIGESKKKRKRGFISGFSSGLDELFGGLNCMRARIADVRVHEHMHGRRRRTRFCVPVFLYDVGRTDPERIKEAESTPCVSSPSPLPLYPLGRLSPGFER